MKQDKKVTNNWPKAKNEKVIAQRLTWHRTEGYYCKSKAGLYREGKRSANERNVKTEQKLNKQCSLIQIFMKILFTDGITYNFAEHTSV